MAHWMRRYEEESIAIEAAKRYSRSAKGVEYSVLESPHQESPSAGRFVVETDGPMIRSWERLIGVFVNGRKIRS